MHKEFNGHNEYIAYQEEKFRRYESICKRCGACCGAIDGDPCKNLGRDSNGRYYCKVYENRFGPQQTISGKWFNCTPIREVIAHEGARPGCAYRRLGIAL